jgi:uncharacterized protein YndB with AHSA1/START domain
MVDVSTSITINRSVEDVFAYVTDVTNDPAWHTDALEVEKLTEGPIGMGTRWRVRFKPSMGVSEGNMEVVAHTANHTQTMHGQLGPMEPTITYVVEPTDGGTTFTRRVQIKVSGWMKIMSPMMGMMTRKRNQGFPENLKRVLEGNPSGPPSP